MTDLSAPLSRRSIRRRNASASRPRHLRAAVLLGGLALLGLAATGPVLLGDLFDRRHAAPATAMDPAQVAGGTPVRATITADPEMIPVPQADVAPKVIDVAAAGSAAIDPDLIEETEFGPVPRISATGETPFSTYSRAPEGLVTGAGNPAVAIVVSGLGINRSGTLEAIDRLPAEVTLAFAPYGDDLERSVASARTGGHEILLEVPLEPFDYPDNDPGPDTLLTGTASADNLNRLHRLMSRFGGYVGLLNNMGARFTASGADFGPVMEELAARGLGYLDDGSSNRSLAAELARDNRVPFARVDAVVDANPSRGSVLAQLQALEEKARSSGFAIGIISALPGSVEVIAEWARGLGDKGIEIVPASALMGSTNG